MKSRLLLDVVVRKSSSIFQLFSCKDQPLLIWWDSLLVLNLGLHIFNGVRWLNFQSDGLSSESLDKDLHSSSETENQMKSGLLLDVVIRESSAIFQLFSCKDQPLLIWWDSLLVLNLGLNIFNRVRRLNFQSDSLSSKSLNKDLHSSSETKNQMKSGLLLDVVVRKSSSNFQLLSSKDQPLLIWWDSLLVLNLGLHIFNGVR